MRVEVNWMSVWMSDGGSSEVESFRGGMVTMMKAPNDATQLEMGQFSQALNYRLMGHGKEHGKTTDCANEKKNEEAAMIETNGPEVDVLEGTAWVGLGVCVMAVGNW
ncbi:hypothetical protein Ccrd_018560 [Cynara cardunculus var. scolymus]|uniref:Uncharacterized protein n=1 Tax=Cynara cardunculus var. scolymus TaxID=59895 RepID=A0A103Y5Z9_CYNCS|nr:hypothetical protein Ccrd_018560 [Cynara cardunculus var. scolymus]